MSTNRRVSAAPGAYEIVIDGQLDAQWSNRLGGLNIKVIRDDGAPVTVLTGNLADQSALLGVLNTLGAIGMPLRSVVNLKRSEESGR